MRSIQAPPDLGKNERVGIILGIIVEWGLFIFYYLLVFAFCDINHRP